MAILHRGAQVTPSKLELLAAWLPGRPWWHGEDAADLARVAACRFDDPAGEVGIEMMLVRAGDGPIHQVPLTYRNAPLDDAEGSLVGTAEHSVLGRRWVYDACADPVYVAAVVQAIFANTGQAEEFVEIDGRSERRAPSMTISSDAVVTDAPVVGPVRRVVQDNPTLIVTDGLELAVVRRLGASNGQPGATLNGTWDEQAGPQPLAYATPR